MSFDGSRRGGGPRGSAEAAFKSATTRPREPDPREPALPGIKELVSLRIDKAVIEHFQDGGPGWQDRINETLKRAVAAETGSPEA
jgi:uncharacterized protein (DUF4415 family)